MTSPILAFVSIFLGLTYGSQPVEILVGEGVERVEIHLDGSQVGWVTEPDWTMQVDFGQRLEPHHLLAVALDDAGEELARVDQWINLPTPTAEANVMIDRDADGSAWARLTWANVMGDDPESVLLSLDGHQVEFTDPKHIQLPEHDLAQLHFLRAELRFAHNVSVVEEVTFGGSYGDQLSTELTALPILIADNKKALPATTELADWFRIDGATPTIAAVDEGPAEIVVIRDVEAQGAIERLVAGNASRATTGAGMSRSFYASRFDNNLRRQQNLAFFWPFMVQAPSGLWTFPPPYGWMTPEDGGLGWFLASVPPPKPPDGGPQLLADAVAVAGMNALTRNRRRAVVLILGPEPADGSRLSPGVVRHYLDTLRVPLAVWSPYPKANSNWGQVVDISSQGKLRQAVTALAKSVERQRVIWFRGRHLPQDIRLVDAGNGVEFPG